jgi:hypothetical protein
VENLLSTKRFHIASVVYYLYFFNGGVVTICSIFSNNISEGLTTDFVQADIFYTVMFIVCSTSMFGLVLIYDVIKQQQHVCSELSADVSFFLKWFLKVC